MSKVFEDKKCTESVLSVILKKELTVISVKTQYKIDNLHGRSIILDIRAIDNNNTLYDIEIENNDKRATPKRARYNISIMDSDVLDKNQTWDKLPETYMIFITREDILGGNEPIYHIDRTITEMKHKIFNDKTHIIYVNSKIQDDTELGRLMHDLNCIDPGEIYNKNLAERINYFKTSTEGVTAMCTIMEQVADERERETMLKCIKQLMINCKFTVEQAMRNIGIPKSEEEFYIELLKKSQ